MYNGDGTLKLGLEKSLYINLIQWADDMIVDASNLRFKTPYCQDFSTIQPKLMFHISKLKYLLHC